MRGDNMQISEYPCVYEMRADQKYYFNIIYYDINENNPKPDDPVHFHKSLEFVYVAEGTFPVHIEGITYNLKKGDVAYVRSGQIHYFTSSGDAKIFVLVVSLDYLDDPLYNGQCPLPNVITLLESVSDKVSSLLFCMFALWQVGNTSLAKGIFNSFYGLIYEYTSFDQTSGGSKFPIYAILKYIDHHFTENITLKGLAKNFNYSETYFSSCFKAHLNMSLPEYLNRIRIGYANKLIEQGMTKNKAAAACGYKSSNTFFRAYKKYHIKHIKDIEEILEPDSK